MKDTLGNGLINLFNSGGDYFCFIICIEEKTMPEKEKKLAIL